MEREESIVGGKLFRFFNNRPLDLRNPQKFIGKAKKLTISDVRNQWVLHHPALTLVHKAEPERVTFEFAMDTFIDRDHPSVSRSIHFEGLENICHISRLIALTKMVFPVAWVYIAYAQDPSGNSMPEGIPDIEDEWWNIHLSDIFPPDVYKLLRLKDFESVCNS